MASAATTKQTTRSERSVSQLCRIAVRIGEDFYTFENLVTLPPGASDEEIAEAIDTGTRIYQAQRRTMDAQIITLRAAVPSILPAPPTKKQLEEVGRLQGLVSIATIAAVYKELEIEGVAPQSKAEASALIGRLRAIVNGIAPDPAADRNVADAAQPQQDEASEDVPF